MHSFNGIKTLIRSGAGVKGTLKCGNRGPMSQDSSAWLLESSNLSPGTQKRATITLHPLKSAGRAAHAKHRDARTRDHPLLQILFETAEGFRE